jgi:quercetin dioxygenase-like cupin family protein
MIAFHADSQETILTEKTSRRVLIHGGPLMLVEFRFAKGGIGDPHSHADHDQIGYVAKGSFEITVGGVTKIAREGDSYLARPNVVHGVVALEDDSVLIDTFTPIREDFLGK